MEDVHPRVLHGSWRVPAAWGWGPRDSAGRAQSESVLKQIFIECVTGSAGSELAECWRSAHLAAWGNNVWLLFLPDCAGCGRDIKNGQALLALEKQWHLGCFKCKSCGKVLTGEYISK